jgi:serine/threonine protein kinase
MGASVLDFGMAVPAPTDPGVTEASPLTTEGMVMGTVPYMSPEQVRGERVDSRSDIFSLGTMLYRWSRASFPFRAATIMPPVSPSSTRCPADGRVARRYSHRVGQDRHAVPGKTSGATLRHCRRNADELRATQDTGARATVYRTRSRRPRWWLVVGAAVVLAAGIAGYAPLEDTPAPRDPIHRRASFRQHELGRIRIFSDSLTEQ